MTGDTRTRTHTRMCTHTRTLTAAQSGTGLTKRIWSPSSGISHSSKGKQWWGSRGQPHLSMALTLPTVSVRDNGKTYTLFLQMRKYSYMTKVTWLLEAEWSLIPSLVFFLLRHILGFVLLLGRTINIGPALPSKDDPHASSSKTRRGAEKRTNDSKFPLSQTVTPPPHTPPPHPITITWYIESI